MPANVPRAVSGTRELLLLGEAAHVQLVDNQIVAVARSWRTIRDTDGLPWWQHAERGFPGIRAGPAGSGSIMARRKEYAGGIRIEQDLLIVEPLPLARVGGARDPVTVVAGPLARCRRNPHVPDAVGLVAREFERDAVQWRREITVAVQQKRHLVGMFGVDCEVVGLFGVDPGGAQWRGGAFKPFPFVEHDRMPRVFFNAIAKALTRHQA